MWRVTVFGVRKTHSQFFKNTLKTVFYTKPRFKLFVIPPYKFTKNKHIIYNKK